MILPDNIALPILCGVCKKEIEPISWGNCPSSGGWKFFFKCHGKQEMVKTMSKGGRITLEPFKDKSVGTEINIEELL